MLGQEVDLALLASVGGLTEDALLDLTDVAIAAWLLDVDPDGATARFSHALVRDVLYTTMSAQRRRTLHRRIGEAIAARPMPDPDALAYHFRQAGDSRAVPWLIEAGKRAQRAFAFLTAAAPYERAVTLLALADLRACEGRLAEALNSIADARAILAPLRAAPALGRADALAARLSPAAARSAGYPAGLTAREVDVLRLVAAGRSNRDIADALYLSVRTVERHITNIYTKIDARNRVDAAAFVARHGLQ